MFPCSWMFFFPSFSTPLVSGVYVCSPSPPWNPSAFLSPRAASTCFLADSMDTCARDGTIETKGMAPVPGVVWIWVTMVKVVQTESILGKKNNNERKQKGLSFRVWVKHGNYLSGWMLIHLLKNRWPQFNSWSWTWKNESTWTVLQTMNIFIYIYIVWNYVDEHDGNFEVGTWKYEPAFTEHCF